MGPPERFPAVGVQEQEGAGIPQPPAAERQLRVGRGRHEASYTYLAAEQPVTPVQRSTEHAWPGLRFDQHAERFLHNRLRGRECVHLADVQRQTAGKTNQALSDRDQSGHHERRFVIRQRQPGRPGARVVALQRAERPALHPRSRILPPQFADQGSVPRPR